MSRRQAATGLAAGLCLMLTAPAVWWVAQPEPAGQTVTSVNAAAAAELASDSGQPASSTPSSAQGSTPASPAPTSTASASSVPGTSAPTSSAAKTSAPKSSAPKPAPPEVTAPKVTAPKVTAPKVPAAPPAAPVRIELPSLGVDAPVIPAGVDSEGVMEIPKDVGEVGWYRFGPAPGAVKLSEEEIKQLEEPYKPHPVLGHT